MAGTYPDSQIPRARSARQQFWLDHLRAWRAQGTSLRSGPRLLAEDVAFQFFVFRRACRY